MSLRGTRSILSLINVRPAILESNHDRRQPLFIYCKSFKELIFNNPILVTKKIERLHYKDQQVVVANGKNHCLFWESYGNHKNVLCGENADLMIGKAGNRYLPPCLKDYQIITSLNKTDCTINNLEQVQTQMRRHRATSGRNVFEQGGARGVIRRRKKENRAETK